MMASIPFGLLPLDVQLAAVDMHASETELMSAEVRDALLRHRDVIDALRRGINIERWPESVMPPCARVLDSVPGLLKLPAWEAAQMIADRHEADGRRFLGTEALRKSVRTRLLRNRLVGAIKKRARHAA